MTSPKDSTIDSLLKGPGQRYSALVQQAQRWTRYNKLLQSVLDDSIRKHCQLGSVNKNRIVLLAESPAWAARIRLHSTTMRKQLRARTGNQDLLIVVKVRPIVPAEPDTTLNPATLSQSAIQTIRRSANTISDETLRKALLRITRNKPG